MEAYNSSSSSSSKSSYLFQNTEESKPKGVKQEHPLKFHSLLHSVKKSPAKSWKKAPPMPPTPVKVYKVDAINFKDLVQHLTCAPEFMPPHPHQQFLQRIEHAANSIDDHVPSLPLQNLLSKDTAAESPPPLPVCTTDNWYHHFLNPEDFGKTSPDGEMIPSGLLDMNLFSPTSYGNFCFYPPIISPRM